nr:S-layer homology domain-containing protein [Paenibacillus sp. GSMTC-2017]
MATLAPPPPVVRAVERIVEENFTATQGHWAENTVIAAKKKETISGYDDGSFKPDQDVSRAEFVTFVNKGLGLNPRVYDTDFRDVSSMAWFAKDIAIGQKSGYIQGFNGLFRPDASITREEAAVIIQRLMSEKQSLVDKKLAVTFADESQIASWSLAAVEQVT